ncbi:MAG: 30S ribosomal protein S15, partial [Nanoarchaeota archaeon]|nr:30S ribosomal protein S15 [Nanoarchaeota archaeon]
SELPEDLLSLVKKSVALSKHLEENNPDKTAKRGLRLTQSKIGRLVKYYKRTGRLPESWKYDESRFKLMVE